MAERVDGLSSMATKQLLRDLGESLRRRCSVAVHVESAGGVDIARHIRAGAQADLVVLDREMLLELDGEGLLRAGTLRPLFVSDVVAAAPENRAAGPIATEAELRALLIDADRIAYSTGPSGKGVIDLISRWGLEDVVTRKLVQAGAGTPVASLLAGGEADLGFQQRSEFAGARGVRVLGPLPGAAAIRSTFSGAVLATSRNQGPARAVLAFLASDDAEAYVMAAGMSQAQPADRRTSHAPS